MLIQSVDDLIKAFLEKKFRQSKSFATKISYQTALNKFQEFVRVKYNRDVLQTLGQLERKELDPIEVLDEFYTFLSKYPLKHRTGYSNRSMTLYLVATKEFLNGQGLHIYNEDVRQKFKLPKPDDVYEEGLTKETIVRILHNSSQKLQTAILLACSSGLRLSELCQLKISDIDFTTNPTTIHVRRETAKTRTTRFTCITSEACQALKDYLTKTFGWTEAFRLDRYIFLQTYEDRLAKLNEGVTKKYTNKEKIKAKIEELKKEFEGMSPEQRLDKAVHSAKSVLQDTLITVIKTIPDLQKKSENGRNVIHFHAFRSWFKVQVTDAHESDFAESLLGHKSLKLTYYRQNPGARNKTYLKVEPALTISDLTKVEATMEDLKAELTSVKIELEKQRQRIEIAEKYEKRG